MGGPRGAGDRGPLAVAGVLAGLLVLSSVSSFVAAYDLSEALVQGEGEIIYGSIRASLPLGRPQSDADLAGLLADSKPAGLRYVAILDREGEVVAAAGTPAARPRSEGASQRGVLGWLGDNLQAERSPVRLERLVVRPGGPEGRREGRGEESSRRRHGGPHGGGPSEASPAESSSEVESSEGGPPEGGPPEGGPPSHRGPPPPRVVIEFEPQLAAASFQRAIRDLLVSLAVAIAWVLATLLLYRLRKRASQAEGDLAERRHLAALGEMSAVIAHEIRNPLASLKGHAQLLEEQLADNERRRAKARRIVDEAVRLEELTKSLLDFVRSGNLKAGEADPRAVAQRAAEMVDAARVDIDASGAPTSWPFDPMRIEQVLVNLLRNGLQAGSEGGRVDLTLACEDGGLIFAVADRGKGIPADMRERLFDPFVTGRTQGTGLGLAVVRRVTESHGGRVTVLDRPGGGTIFKVWLPAKPRAKKEP